MMEEVEYGSDTWEVVEEGEWTQDYKYQHKKSVVKHIPTGKFYQYEVSRSLTDWCYSYEYGEKGQLVKALNPDNTFRLFDYDKYGNLIKFVDEEERETLFKHDFLGNVKEAISPDKRITSYFYD